MFSPLVDLASFLKYANKYAPLVLLGKLLLSSAAEADRPAKGRLVASISTDRNKDNSRLDTLFPIEYTSINLFLYQAG